MFLSRLAVLLLLPFLAAAFIPWLNAEATPRVLLITLIWSALLNVFFVGMTAGSALAQDLDSTRIKLLRITVVTLLVMWLLVILVYAALSPVVALGLAVVAQMLGMQKVSRSDLWQRIAATQRAFLQRIAWVTIGCQLMLALSYTRFSGGL